MKDLEKILIVTDIPFWERGIGNRERLFLLIEDLRAVSSLSVYYTGEVTKSKTPEHIKIHIPLNRRNKLFLTALNKIQRVIQPVALKNIVLKSLGKEPQPIPFEKKFLPLDKLLFRLFIKANRPNTIIYEYLRMWSLFKSTRGIPYQSIIDTHDVQSLRQESLVSNNLTPSGPRLTFDQEVSMLKSFDKVITIQKEEEYLLNSLMKGKVCTYGLKMFPKNNKNKPKTDKINILFLGINSHPNQISLDFILKNIFPKIKSFCNLYIAGSVCDHVAIIDDDSIIRLGVIDRLSEIYANIHAIINPTTIKGGLKIKNIEALSYGCAVITSPTGAEGLKHFIDSGYLFICERSVDYLNALKLIKEQSHFDYSRLETSFSKYIDNDVNNKIFLNGTLNE